MLCLASHPVSHPSVAELKALAMEADACAEGAKETGKVARRVKKSSKDLTDTLGGMKAQLDTLAGAADAWQALGSFGKGVRRERRGSKDLELELKSSFDAIDADGSGELDMAEIKAALMERDPTATDEDVEKLLLWADKDGNGACSGFVSWAVAHAAPCHGVL